MKYVHQYHPTISPVVIKTISVPSSTTMYTIDGVSNGTNITVFAENAIGNGTKEYKTICKFFYSAKTLLYL